MHIHEHGALPPPLTPPDCDLRDFAFMPLEVARLRDSDMASEQTPEQNWAAVMLWAAAWHQQPAGSIPDSDNWMAKTAGYLARGRIDPHWAEVRVGALRGFVLCSDGRWYHPVVAEKANESWRAKLGHAWRKECDRIRKANKQRVKDGLPDLPFPPEPGLHSAKIPEERSGVPSESKSNSGGSDASFQNADDQIRVVEEAGAPQSAQQMGFNDGVQVIKTDPDRFLPEVMEIPSESMVNSSGISFSPAGIPPENALKGQGQGQGQGDVLKPTIPDGIVVAGESAGGTAGPKRPDCPQQQIIALYHEVLPMCPVVRQWTDARAKQLRSRWNEEPERQSLAYWRSFFENIRYNCPFLIGQKPGREGRPFMVTLDWITKQANFVKIIEGNFADGASKPAEKGWI